MRRKATAASLGLVSAAAYLVVATGPAVADVQATIYASPTGSGTSCSSPAPCSLATAKSQAEALAPTATGDINVVLLGGTYSLSSTLTFTTADTPANGHILSFSAAAGSHVVFSGGASITGWTLHDSALNIWQAPAPNGLVTRQIYVNGVRAGIDTGNTTAVFGSMTKTSTGYTYTSTGPNSWTNTAGVDLVYSGKQSLSNPWQHDICPASSIGSGTITMQNPCWSLGNAGYTSDPKTNTQVTLGIPSAVQNNYALLGQPGQFYLDSTAHEIYYVPRAGEDLTTASVIAPQLQTLLEVDGAATNPVQNLTFRGITFAYGTWTFGNQGVLNTQGNDIYGATADVVTLIPANVACHGCSNVSFVGNTFTHLGGAGLAFDGGGTNDVATGNIVTDVSSNGIQLGDGGTAEPAAIESGDVITDNYVDNVGVEYLSGMGIFAAWVKNTTIAHNEVSRTPEVGISLGWGWGVESAPIPMVSNVISDNYVHDVMDADIYDGGDIYVNGTQGSAGSTMDGNYIAGSDSQQYAALYLDNGASYWAVTNNVAGGYASSWGYVQAYGGKALNNTVANNYAWATAGVLTPSSGIDSSNTISNNTSGLTAWPAAAQSIIAAAGLEPAYQYLHGGSPMLNMAFGATPTVSSSFPSANPASSDDGNANTVWATANGDAAPSWQVDLGAAKTITDIQILLRTDQWSSVLDATNLKIIVSNSASLTAGYTIACTTGSIPMPFQSLLDCPAPAGTWRYVAILKTDTSELVFSEARVFGSAVPTSADDASLGAGNLNWNYVGQGWIHCTANCNSQFGATFYNGTISYDKVTSDYATMNFVGTGVAFYGLMSPTDGTASIQIDQLPASTVSWYSPSSANTLVYSSPPLSWGPHTVTVRVAGLGAGGGPWVNIDRAVVT